MNKFISLFQTHKIVALIIMSLLLGFFTVLISSSVASFIYDKFPLDPMVNDPEMFYLMGKAFVGGKIPYVEIFDHKGLYIFYYTGLGYLLGGKVGLFILQTIFLATTYFFMIKTFNVLKVKKSISFMGVLLFFTIYSVAMQSPGDYEPQLPFIALMVYFYLKGVTNEDDKSFMIGNIFSGIATGLAINIRASDAMVPFGIVIFYAVYAIKHKKYQQLLFNALICVGMIGVICLIPFLHSSIGNFREVMYQSVIFDNFKYVGSSSDRDSQYVWASRIIIIALSLLFFLPLIFKRKTLYFDEFLFFTVSGGVMFVIQLILAFYPHYLLIMLSFILIEYGRVFDLFIKEEKKTNIIISVLSLSIALVGALYYPINYYVNLHENNEMNLKIIQDNVPEIDRKNGNVLLIDLSSSYYLNLDFVSNYSDFSVQSNHVLLSKTHSLESLIAYLKSGDAHYVVTSLEETRANAWIKSGEAQTYFNKINAERLEVYKYVFEG